MNKGTIEIESNRLPESGITPQLYQLCGAIQDMWHYAALIKPPPDGRVSTFEGSREYKGLIGKLQAYEALVAKVEGWQLDCLPAFTELTMPDLYDIDTLAQLLEHTGYIIHAINVVAQANRIDAYAGKQLPVEGKIV